MAFPVEPNDSQAIVDGLNYLLSGPAGLGQNFSGFSESLSTTYYNGQYKQPWNQPTQVPWYVNIGISNITGVGAVSDQFTVTFSSAQPSPPFEYGQTLTIANVVNGGIIDPSFYNYGSWKVWSCTTTDCVIVTNNTYTWADYPYVSGGDIGWDYSIDQPNYKSTDCNARVTVQGPTTRVFVSAQIPLQVYYDCGVATGQSFQMIANINRYRGTPTTETNDNDYVFAFDKTIASSLGTEFTGLSGASSVNQDFIFTTVIDEPNFGYYWYILELQWVPLPTFSAIKPGAVMARLGPRSLTAQVIKE